VKRIKKIGDIELENSLFLLETFNVKNVKAKSFSTLDGGTIIYESVKRDNANLITLDSKNGGWIKEETLVKIVSLADNIGKEMPITDTNGNSLMARFRLEDRDVITVSQIYEGSEWYKVVLKMAKI